MAFLVPFTEFSEIQLEESIKLDVKVNIGIVLEEFSNS